MGRFILIILVLLLGLAQPLFAAKRTIYVDGQASFPVNTNPDTDKPQGYPSFLYTDPSLFGSRLAGRFVVAGLYNSARFSFDPDHQEEDHWNMFYEVRTTLIYAGDSPVIDGQSMNGQNFKANMMGNNAGAQYLFKMFKFDWRAGVRYDGDFYFPYGETDPTQFIRPDFYIEQGPTLFVESREIPPMDIMLFGIYPMAKIEQKFRNGLNQWGPIGNTSSIGHYFRPTFHIPFGLPLWKRVILSGRGFGGYITEADRMNAIKFGSMIQLGNSTTNLPGPGMYSNEVYAKAIIGGALGLRFVLDREAKSKLVVFPFVHGARYNELLVGNTLRSNGVGGTGIHLTGRVQKKFFWDLGYANVFGLQRQSNPSHEIYVRLLWIPWEREVAISGVTEPKGVQ